MRTYTNHQRIRDIAFDLIGKRNGCTPNSSQIKAKLEKHKHGCGIFTGTPSRSNLTQFGFNKFNTNSASTIHAEMDALIKYRNSPAYSPHTKLSLVVVRTNGGNSRPCMHCIDTMTSGILGSIKNVYYTDGDNITKESISSLKENATQHVSFYNRSVANGEIGVDDEDDDEEGEEDLDGKPQRLLIFPR